MKLELFISAALGMCVGLVITIVGWIWQRRQGQRQKWCALVKRALELVLELKELNLQLLLNQGRWSKLWKTRIDMNAFVISRQIRTEELRGLAALIDDEALLRILIRDPGRDLYKIAKHLNAACLRLTTLLGR